MRAPRQKGRRGRPVSGTALSAAERMQRLRERRRAAGLKAVTSWLPSISSPWSSHSLHDARSLAMHVLIARKVERDPSLLDIARANLERWSRQRGNAPSPAHIEWQVILSKPWAEVAALLAEQSARAVRLRQSSPFAGILGPAERRRINEAFRA